jgi:cell pole-organizing protein PopZ
MEEIIASISRLIAEDKAIEERPRAAFDNRDDILDLTEAIVEDGSVRRLVPQGQRPLAGSETASSAARIEPEPPRAASAPDHGPDRLVSAATAQAAASAFSRLGEAARQSGGVAAVPHAASARTLDDIVRESLRPLLRAWLDEHLPTLVERLVREEIARLSDAAGPR